jgi:DNA primase
VARYPEHFIHQVAQATDIVDLVGQYVALKRRGKEFVGLCPFHDDTRPSLNVSPGKQIFKCFACGAGGGVFQFVMLYDKLAFPEAIRALADRAGIRVPQEAGEPTPGGLSKTDLLGVTAFAAEFFRRQLGSPAGQAALDYARGRGLSDQTIERFGLGYAPDAWDALRRAAGRRRIGDRALVAAGLAARRETGGGCYDRFRNRLMFPIHDLAGRVIAFGGRALAEDQSAKYLNSADSPVFDKSATLYALHAARGPIGSTGQAVVVEGYLDALIPQQAGLTNVVATLGTALTDRQVRLLGRYAREAVVVFDADAAGAAAAERALEVFLAQQVHVRVATIPAGKDPCDVVQASGADALRGLLADAPDAIEHLWQRRREAYQAAQGRPAARRRIIEDFLRVVVSCSAWGAIDEMRRGQLAQHIAHMLNVSAGELQRQMRRLGRQAPRRGPAADAPSPPASASTAERQVLEVLLNRPDLFDEAGERLEADQFEDPALQPVARRVWQLAAAGELSLEEVLASSEIAAAGALVTDLAAAGAHRGNYERTLAGAVGHLVYRRARRDMAQWKQGGYTPETLRKISHALRCPDARRRPRIR